MAAIKLVKWTRDIKFSNCSVFAKDFDHFRGNKY